MTDLVNAGSKTYKELGGEGLSSLDFDAAGFIHANPKAMKRPLLTDGKRLAVGFKAEEFSALID